MHHPTFTQENSVSFQTTLSTRTLTLLFHIFILSCTRYKYKSRLRGAVKISVVLHIQNLLFNSLYKRARLFLVRAFRFLVFLDVPN